MKTTIVAPPLDTAMSGCRASWPGSERSSGVRKVGAAAARSATAIAATTAKTNVQTISAARSGVAVTPTDLPVIVPGPL
jgi:hypothetical protein